jgi:UDP-N-acetylglucosamine 2-epimerase (non-hydrolysing)
MLVFGTRPEAIKMAPLVKELQKHPNDFRVIVTVTAQHREMLDQVLSIFDIVPDYDLNIMKPGQDLYDVSANVLLGLRSVLANEKPDIVLVHGDTTTSTMSALAAFYQQIPVGHIEAGLRTHNVYNPWPEEMNRQLTGRITTFHFAPTELSKNNLLQELVAENKIVVTGNTVIDALHLVLERIQKQSELSNEIAESITAKGYPTSRLVAGKKMVLITGHRRENFGDGFLHICNALKTLCETFTDVDFVYPMHLNPNVRKPISEIFSGTSYSNMFFIEPLDYVPFVYMMDKSNIILTDSGGIQEEAPSLGKPVLVMRTTTERPEAVDAGTVLLVGTDTNTIIAEVSNLLTNANSYAQMSRAINPYGDGKACGRIITFLKSDFILFKTEDEKISVDVRFEDETVWLTQEQMALLFGKAKSTINEHIQEYF